MRLTKLSQETNMPINQENGQRHYGPPFNWYGPPPTKGSEVFVNHLPRDCLEDELVPVFSSVGRIYLMRMMMDFSGMNRGFCFVTYSSPALATQAIHLLNNYQIRADQRLRVTRSMDNCRLYIGHINGDINKDELVAQINCLVPGVKDVILSRCGEDMKRSLCFCFIEFECHKAAATARRLLSTSAVEIFGSEVKIEWAEPDIHNIDHRLIKQVTVVYVRNVPINCKEEALLNVALLFTKGENIIKLKKMYDYAFIDCIDRESAEQLLSGIHGYTLEGRVLEASWARHHIQGFSSRNKMKMEQNYFDGGDSANFGSMSTKTGSPSRQFNRGKICISSCREHHLSRPSDKLAPGGGSRIQGFFSFLNCSRDSQSTGVIAQQIKELIMNAVYSYSRPSKAIEVMANQLKWGLVKYYVYENKMHCPSLYFASVGIGDSEETMSYFAQHGGPTADDAVEAASQAFIQNLLQSTDLIVARHSVSESVFNIPQNLYDQPLKLLPDQTQIRAYNPLFNSSHNAPLPPIHESLNSSFPNYPLHTA